MAFTIDLDNINKLIIYKHNGTIKKEDIGKAWEQFLKLKEFTEQKYNLLSDYSEAKFDFQIDDVQAIIGILFSLKEILNGKKQALIVTDPRSTAASILFENDVVKEVGFIVKVFSTRAEAVKWLVR